MTIDKCIDILDDNFTVIDTHGHYTDEEESEALSTAVKSLNEWERVRQEIKKNKSEIPTGWIPVERALPEGSDIVLLSLPEHTMADGEECSPCVICGHYIGGNSEEWGISDGTTVGYGLVVYKHCKPIAWMPLPEPYKASPTGAEGSEE